MKANHRLTDGLFGSFERSLALRRGQAPLDSVFSECEKDFLSEGEGEGSGTGTLQMISRAHELNVETKSPAKEVEHVLLELRHLIGIALAI